jgi:hypothetical protein
MCKAIRVPLVFVLILILASGLVGCKGDNKEAEAASAAEEALMQMDEWDLVVIGDSSMFQVGKALGAAIEADVGVTVNVYDATIGGLSAGTVLAALEDPDSTYNPKLKNLSENLGKAEMVVFHLNPEESISEAHPFDSANCLGPVYKNGESSPEMFEVYVEHLERIISKILELRDGQPVIIRVVELYNPLVSVWQEEGVFEDCTQFWVNYNGAMHQAAEKYGVPVVERYQAFNGPDHTEDPRAKGYILPDGEHLNELGVQKMVELIQELGYEPVEP